MKVSVIIAVYNTERFLPECLDSLLRQSHQDWEAWCVDDCSTDGSLKVLEKYAKNDARFHVIRLKENSGLAVARNKGIAECQGRLIAFLDSDDWLSDDGLEKVCETFTSHPNTGCVLWDCKYVYKDHTDSFDMLHFEVMPGKEAFEKSLRWEIHGVYVTTAEIHNKYLYDETAKWYSDENVTRLHYLASKEVRTCSGKYFYRQHEGSVTHSVNIHHFDMLDACDSLRSQLKQQKVDENTITHYEEIRWRRLLDCYLYSYVYRQKFTTDERRKINERMQRFFEDTEYKRLPKSLTRKFGCSPVGGWWWLFKLQEELYFSLRGIMRRNIIAIVVLISLMLSLSITSSAQDMSKMSLFVRKVAVEEHLTVPNKSHNRVKNNTHDKVITALVQTDSDDDIVLVDNNCRCLAHWDDIHVVSIPLAQLSQLSCSSAVKRIETKERNSICIDTVRIINHVKEVHSGDNLPQAFTGNGVVMGIEDIGFDLTHPTFYSSDGEDYRVRRFWDMLDVADMDLSIETEERALLVGKEFTTREEILAKAHATDGLNQTHGTHTAGIAAGSGYDGTGICKYMGMAPSADLCLVANAVSDDINLIPEELQYLYTAATDLLGFKYIFDYAESVGKPCVISFSEGSHEDLYGDSQLMYEALDRMTGPGRIIVSSAGNEGAKLTYLHKPLGITQNSSAIYGKNALFTIKSTVHHDIQLDFYNVTEKIGEVRLSSRDIIQIPDSLLLDTFKIEDKEYYLAAASYPSCYNKDEWVTELLLQASDKSYVGQYPYYVVLHIFDEDNDIEVYASGGQFLNTSQLPEYNQAEQTHNINFPSAAPAIICVGSSAWVNGHYNYEGVWKESDAGKDGIRTYTSSVGPTMQGHIKPDVLAPGMNIISAYSSYYLENHPTANDIKWDVCHFDWNGRTYPWNANSGTSMSSPVVGGIVALWLEACPTLTPDDVRETIAATSRHYSNVITYPNNEYGYGEIDAYAGLLHVLKLDRIKDISTSRPSALTIRPNGKCVYITSTSPSTSDIITSIYNIKGELIHQQTLIAGQASYHIDANLPAGVYAIQCNSKEKALCGSELIRISE